MFRFNNYKKMGFVATALATLLGTQVATAAVLEEVLVTAQKREQGIQDVPISLQALAGDALSEGNIFALDDVAEKVPNVTFSTTPGNASIFIRGAGTGSVNNSAEQSVGMFVDGAYVSRGFQFTAPFLDLERVEILKGPQGVLQGKNSIAGAVLLSSKRPGKETDGYVRAGYDLELGSRNLEAAATLAITDNWSVRLAAQSNFEGGYIDTTSRPSFDGIALQGREDQNTNEFSVIRLSTTFAASENLAVFLKLESGETERRGVSFGPTGFQPGTDLFQGAGAIVLPFEAYFRNLDPNFGFIQDGVASGAYPLEIDPSRNQYVPTDDIEFYQDVQSDSGLLQLDWDLGDLGTVTAISSYSQYEVQASSANTMAPYDGFSVYQNRGGNNTEEFDQFTQEIRLVSPGGETLDYVVGAYYLNRNILRDGNGTALNVSNSILTNLFAPALANSAAAFDVDSLPPSIMDSEDRDSFDENTEHYAAFGQVTWNVSEQLRLNIGGRYSSETKQVLVDRGAGRVFLNQTPFGAPVVNGIFGVAPFTEADLPQSSRDESSFDPSLSVQYDSADDLTLYGSWTKATKGGGFNEGANTKGTFIFEEETATGIEVGLKSTLMDGRMTLNVALFETQYEDLQVSALDTQSAVPTFIFQNAAEATSKGVEADFRLAASDNLELGGAIGLLDAAYDDFPGAGCANGSSREANCVTVSPTVESRNAAGDTLRFAPEWTASVYSDYRKTLGNGMTLGLRGDVKYRDDAFIAATNDPFLVQDAFAKVDLLVSLTSESGLMTVSVVGKNVTDKKTASFGGPTPFFNGAYWSNLDRPREVYVNFQYNF